MVNSKFDRNVFLNCPLDEEYEPLLQAILFCLVRFGLTPRIAIERSDAGETRIHKILELIASSRYSTHDISRCQAREAGEHYRLNMPFELGMDFGCRHYGRGPLSTKVILVLEEQPYRYQAAISDLAGTDIAVHGGKYQLAVRKIRNWLSGMGKFEQVSATRILAEYEDFHQWHYEQLLAAGFSDEDIQDYPTAELLEAMFQWTREGKPRQ